MSPTGHSADALPACRFVGGGCVIWRSGGGGGRGDVTAVVARSVVAQEVPFLPQDQSATGRVVRREEALQQAELPLCGRRRCAARAVPVSALVGKRAASAPVREVGRGRD